MKFFYTIRLDIIKMLFEIGDEPVELNTTFTVTMRIDTSTGSKQESMLISILFCPYYIQNQYYFLQLISICLMKSRSEGSKRKSNIIERFRKKC